MQHVITAQQARQITGGRQPHMPVEYEDACKALEKCLTIDEAKYWNDKADALAAWAKIYRSKDAERKARQLKLHAYRRMGILAQELRPQKRKKMGEGSTKGAKSLLMETGFTEGTANQIRRVSRLSEKEFSDVISRPRPPAPTMVRPSDSRISDAWFIFASSQASGMGAIAFRSFCRRHSPADLAGGISKDESFKARAIVQEISEWLDEFERHLPK